MSRIERKPIKHQKLALAATPNVPVTPSDREWESNNQAAARAARVNVLLRVPCSTRGCREHIGVVELVSVSPPSMRVVVRAPGRAEPAPQGVHARIRMLGRIRPSEDAWGFPIDIWPDGSVLEIGCRLGHDFSVISKQDIARRVRDVLA